jgi:hypothetical protein
MEKVRAFAHALERLRLKPENKPSVSSTRRPMSDQELALAIREVRRRSAAHDSERYREVIATAREVLRNPAPDTFLGRKTQTPFPKEDDV